MATFQFIAKNSAGQEQRGTIEAGDRAGAIEAHNFILPILNHIRQNVEEIIYFEKKILMKRGIIATDVCRRPTFSVDDEFEKLFEEYYALTAPRFRHV